MRIIDKKVRIIDMNQKFIPIPVFNEDEPITVHLAGITYPDENYKTEIENSKIYSFEYVISGSGKIIIKNKEISITKGDTYFLPKGQRQEYFSDKDNPLKKIWISVDGPLVDSLMEIYQLSNYTVVHCDTEKFFRQIHEILASKDYTSSEIASKTAIIFHKLIQFIAANKETQENISSDAVLVKNFIDSHIYQQITIDDLSKLIFKSNSHTIRIFKKAYGISPYKYYLNHRMEKIINVLRSTNSSVKEVAFMFGFNDEHYFSSVFKSKTGKNPSFYRKNKNI